VQVFYKSYTAEIRALIYHGCSQRAQLPLNLPINLQMATAMDMQQVQFPTLGRLGIKLPAKIDALATMSQWFSSFAKSLELADVQHVTDLLFADGFWRDLLSLTWDFRTFYSSDILTFLNDRLTGAKVSKVTLNEGSVQLQKPYPDVVWIHASFTFETALGICSGIVRLMPTADDTWKAHTIFTNLEDLHGHPEMVGARREQAPNHGQWLSKRRREIECEGPDEQPSVVIIGAGQSGLEARVTADRDCTLLMFMPRSQRVSSISVCCVIGLMFIAAIISNTHRCQGFDH
jgi:hypothetical protein